MSKYITNEQLFEFMTKMYGEMQEMKENMATKHDIVRLENKIDMNHKALYDRYKLNYEKLTLLEGRSMKLIKRLKDKMLR